MTDQPRAGAELSLAPETKAVASPASAAHEPNSGFDSRDGGQYQQILAMARAGHVDFALLDDPGSLQREHQADKDNARRDQEDWGSDRWKAPRI